MRRSTNKNAHGHALSAARHRPADSFVDFRELISTVSRDSYYGEVADEDTRFKSFDMPRLIHSVDYAQYRVAKWRRPA